MDRGGRFDRQPPPREGLDMGDMNDPTDVNYRGRLHAEAAAKGGIPKPSKDAKLSPWVLVGFWLAVGIAFFAIVVIVGSL